MIVLPEDLRTIRPIAENIDDGKRIEPYIEEVEKLRIIEAIGAPLYKLIEDNKDEHAELLNGGYYDNNKYHFEGLIKAIAYLAYARFVRNNMISVTAFGVKRKQSQFSEDVDEKTLMRHANETEKIGEEYLAQCVKYLIHTNKAYGTPTNNQKQKFKPIGK